MPGTTTGELALQTVVDGDDMEQAVTVILAGAEQTIANEFDSTTGHDHSGAAKGAKIGTGGIQNGITLTSPTFVGTVKGQAGWFDPVMLVGL